MLDAHRPSTVPQFGEAAVATSARPETHDAELGRMQVDERGLNLQVGGELRDGDELVRARV
jgi:hypothetical protein